MSLTGALNSAISALLAQSNAIATVADNLANSSTVGYKTVSTSFASLVTGSDNTSGYSSGGVLTSTRYAISTQGLLSSSTTSTNIAIQGNGFFPVAAEDGGSEVYYTRDGQFDVDADGYLSNNGYRLLGWKTDADGNVIGSTTQGALTPISINDISGSAAPTTTASIEANLPADAETGATFETEMDVYDSLGNASSVTVTWAKTGENSWTATFSDPTSTDGTSTLGTVSSDPVTITFDEDGTLASTDPDPPTLSITGWTTGAADSSITLDLGTAGSADGLTQYASGSDDPQVDLGSIEQDGVAYGTLTGISIGDNGTVMASFSNGEEKAIYKIPVATFANANGLTAMSDQIYAASVESGASLLQVAGTGSAGEIVGSSLEASTTDTNEEFSTMITAQQAYSAAAQVMTTANSMFDTLINSLR